MGTRATSELAKFTSSGSDTIAFVIGHHLVRDCVGRELASRLPGFNVRLVERSEGLVELGDSLSLVVLWIDGGMDETAFEAALVDRL